MVPPNKSINNSPFSIVGRIKTPLQLVSLLIICVSVYWLSIKSINSRDSLILFCVIALLVLAIGILESSNRIKGSSFVFLLTIIYISTASLIGVVLIKLNTPDNKLKNNFTLTLRDSTQKIPSDIKKGEIRAYLDGRPIIMDYDEDDGRFSLTNIEIGRPIRLEIRSKNYRFSNDSNTIWIKLNELAPETFVYLNKQIPKQGTIPIPTQSDTQRTKTFSLSLDDYEIINIIEKSCTGLKYTTAENAFYRVVINYNQRAIKPIPHSNFYEVLPLDVFITVNNGPKNIIGSLIPKRGLSQANAEKHINMQVKKYALEFNYTEILN